MPTDLRATSKPAAEPDGFRVTGRFVLIAMLCFFGTVIGVNAIMAKLAVSTFGGVETESSYKAGQTFKAESAAAQAQKARGWKVEAALSRAADGTAHLDVRPVDDAGRPLSGLVLDAQLRHPTHAPEDRAVAVRESPPGVYTGDTEAAPGLWHLRLDFSRDGERLFRSESRVVLK